MCTIFKGSCVCFGTLFTIHIKILQNPPMSKVKDSDVMHSIEIKDYAKANLLINALEEEFCFEKTKYGQKMLKERICKLKKLLNDCTSKMKVNDNLFKDENQNIKQDIMKLQNITAKKVTFNESRDSVEDSALQNGSNIEIKNQVNKAVTLSTSLQVIFSDCQNITTEYFDCAGSVFIRSTQDSVFTFSAKQIRLVSCSNIVLHVFSETGVFLENCIQIKIKRLDKRIEHKNNCYIVKDFTNPFSDVNYSFI